MSRLRLVQTKKAEFTLVNEHFLGKRNELSVSGLLSANEKNIVFFLLTLFILCFNGMYAQMILAIQLFDELIENKFTTIDKNELKNKRELLWKWILDYPMKNNLWSGYYEDVSSNYTNLNQQNPMETARYILNHPEMDPDYKQHIIRLSFLWGWRLWR
jgi:hypothetical protein